MNHAPHAQSAPGAVMLSPSSRAWTGQQYLQGKTSCRLSHSLLKISPSVMEKVEGLPKYFAKSKRIAVVAHHLVLGFVWFF